MDISMPIEGRNIIVESQRISLWQVFRLIFVIFSLYLLQDVFFRWDGVSYYATFSEFVSSVAFISILWSIVAVLTAIIIWQSLRTFQWLCQQMGWEINVENLLLFTSIIITFGLIVWVSKRLVFGSGSILIVKLIVVLFAIFTSIFISWIFRGKLYIIQERITPLVWLFGIIIILSVPNVIYSIWGSGEDKLIFQESSQSSVVHNRKPNIILITFDAMTARNMSVYGYHIPTTPFISKWSKNATVFTRVEAAGNYTLPATLSLMTGKRLWTHKRYNMHGSKFIAPESLPKVLKDNGYFNIAIIQNPLASVNILGIREDIDIAPSMGKFNRPGSFLGWLNDLLYELVGDKIMLYNWITETDFIFGMFISRISSDVHVTQYPPKRIFDGILSLLSKNPPEPYFIWAHLNPPHDPYLPPKPYMGLFNSSSNLRTQKEQYKFTRSEDGPSLKVDQNILDELRARYDEFIRYCDQDFKYLIEQLQKEDKLKNSVIILSSDHGEGFKRDCFTHGGQLCEEITHIPLIIKEDNQTKGRIIHDLVEQIDIPATILDLASISVPSWMEGRSMMPLMYGNKLSNRPIFSMTLTTNHFKEKITKGSIAVWDGDYKLIHSYNDKKSLLFNLREDPEELDNRFKLEPEVGKRLLTLIEENLMIANEKFKIREHQTLLEEQHWD